MHSTLSHYLNIGCFSYPTIESSHILLYILRTGDWLLSVSSGMQISVNVTYHLPSFIIFSARSTVKVCVLFAG